MYLTVGQGSGKTHTMFGKNGSMLETEGIFRDSGGIVPRLCEDLFHCIEQKKDERTFQVYIHGVLCSMYAR